MLCHWVVVPVVSTAHSSSVFRARKAKYSGTGDKYAWLIRDTLMAGESGQPIGGDVGRGLTYFMWQVSKNIHTPSIVSLIFLLYY